MKKRRLDGKQKLVSFTAQQTLDIKIYCQANGIKSESEFIRQAVVYYIDRDHSDNTLKLSSLKDVKENLSQIQDMLSIIFSYLHQMHGNNLAYHPELDASVKDSAYNSAQQRLERFFTSFQERLKEDPSFFEKLLHKFVTGALD